MDMEKVIKGLEFTKAMMTFNPSTGEDIEPGNLNEANKTSYDACVCAIALLKEQEPKPVGKKWNECPSCGKTLDRFHDMHYCGVCGQAVKWDD